VTDGFRIGMLRRGVDGWVPLDEALAAPDVDLEDELTTLAVTVDGRDHFAQAIGVGPLARFVAELPQAADRLERGTWALLRSAVEDGPGGTFWLLEPDAAGTVSVTIAVAPDEPWAWSYPDEPGADALYAEVETHRDAMVASGARHGFESPALPLDVLVADLRREADVGRELCEARGWQAR
jgi:hypothetical protein